MAARNTDASILGPATRVTGRVSGAGGLRVEGQVRGELRGAEISIEPGSRVSVRLDTAFELDLGPLPKRR